MANDRSKIDKEAVLRKWAAEPAHGYRKESAVNAASKIEGKTIRPVTQPVAKEEKAAAVDLLWDRGEKPTYSKTAEAKQKANKAEKEHQDYIQSDEYKQRTAEREKKLNQDRLVRQLLSGMADVPEPTIIDDEKEAQLRATAERARAEADAAESEEIMQTDLDELSTWSDDDRLALERYAVGKVVDYHDSLNMAQNGSQFGRAEQQAAGLIQKYGQKRVDELAESWNRYQNAKKAQEVALTAQRHADERPVLAALAARPMNVLGGIGGSIDFIRNVGQRTGRYSTLDPDNAGTLLSTYGANVDSKIAQNISGDVYDEQGTQIEEGGAVRQGLAYAYQGLSSLADSVARSYLGGGGLVGTGLMATGTFSQTMADASRQGATPGQAAMLATVNSATEALAEKFPLDELLDIAKGGKQNIAQVLKNAFKQAAVEVTAEEISLVATTMTEAAILREKASGQQRINALIADGASLEEAKAIASKEFLDEAVQTAMVAGFTGSVSGAGSAIVGSVAARKSPDTAQQVQTTEDAASVASAAPVVDETQQMQAVAEETAAEWGKMMPPEIPQPMPEGLQHFDNAAAIANGIEPKAKQLTPQERGMRYKASKVNTAILDLVDRVKRGLTKGSEKVELGTVSDANATQILRETGVDTRGYAVAIEARQVAHILKDHGENGTANRSMANPEDIARIEYALNNPDRITKSEPTKAYVTNKDGKMKPADTVLYETRLEDGSYYVVQAVPETKKKTLYVLTAFIGKSDYHNEAPQSINALDPSATPEAESTVTSREATQSTDIDSPNVTPEAKSAGTSTNSVPENSPEVNEKSDINPAQRAPQKDTQNQSTEGGQPVIKGTGAAEQNFSGKAGYQELLSDDNVQPDRKGDVRPMKVPKTDGYGRNVTEFAANAYGAKVTSDRMAGEIESLIQDGALGFDRRSNKESLDAAYDAIYGKEGKKGRGEAGTLNDIRKNIYDGKIKDGDIEKALLMYAKHASKKGKRSQEYAAELMVDLSTMANMAGRNLQLFKLLRRMTPEGQLMAVEKNVQRYVNDLNKGRSSMKQADVEIPQDLEKDFLTATTDEERDAASDAIYKNVAAQIKPTLGEMWDAWRNLAMLGNPKTHIRNIGGSLAFRPYVSVKRAIGAGIERLTLDQQNRTKAVLGVSKDSRELLKWAKEDGRNKGVMDSMDFSGTTGNESRNEIEDARQILPGKLDTVRKKNMELMEGADMFFKQREYAYSMASFLKARGYSAEDIRTNNVPDSVLAKGRELAVKEAQKATFNDRNKFSDAMSKFRVKGDGGWSKAINAMAKGIMPFTRTPANIVVRAKEYSFVEIARSLDTLTRKVKNGEATVSDGIDQLASGLTGSGTMFLGSALAAGLIPGFRLVGKIEDEDELREGAQEYSVQVGDTYYGISWLAPANIPLFIGANLYNSLSAKEETGELDAWDRISALLETTSDALDPMLELSCLSSLADAIENASYEDSAGDMFLSMMASAATSYFTQGLPTIFGQAEQATETTKSTTYSNADNTVQRAFERAMGNATKRIPGIDLYQTEKLDEFGNVVENEENIFLRTVDAFFNPFTKSEEKNDALTKEIGRLHGVQPDRVSPPDTAKNISFTDANGERHTNRRLTEEEYNKLATVQGQTAKTILDGIIQSDSYKALPDDQKAKIFEYVYDYAREKARAEAIEGYPELSGWMSGIEGSEAKTIMDKAVTAGFTDAFADMTERWNAGQTYQESVEALEQAYSVYEGMSVEERYTFRKEASGRLKYYLDARVNGVETGVFASLYKDFYTRDKRKDLSTSDKAEEWAYKLERCVENRTLTEKQKDVLKNSMVYYQMFPAQTEKFDQMTEAGISADSAKLIVDLLDGIKPQEGYSTVRAVQKAEAIAGTDLSADEKITALKSYLTDAQDLNLDQMLEAGYTPEEYALAYKIYSNESGTGKKQRTIAKYQKEFGVDYATAAAIYNIYG